MSLSRKASSRKHDLNLPARFWAFVSAVAEDVGELHDALKEVSLVFLEDASHPI